MKLIAAHARTSSSYSTKLKTKQAHTIVDFVWIKIKKSIILLILCGLQNTKYPSKTTNALASRNGLFLTFHFTLSMKLIVDHACLKKMLRPLPVTIQR